MRHSSLCRIVLAGLLLTGCGCSKTSAPPATGSDNSTANSANPSAANAANGSPAQPAPTPPPPPPTIVTAQSAGKFKGNALLHLTLDSVRVNGVRYSIQTSEFEEAGKGRGKRTATGAGGGKGAAVGALAGGGAGTAAAGFTGEKDIVLPAETRLHFKLVQPVSFQQGS